MSIDAIKQELSALNKEQQRQLTAFLISIQDTDNAAYRKRLARKIDQPASKFATLEKLDRRLNLATGRR